MIDYETFARIKDFHDREGLQSGQIARKLGLNRRTVAKWLAEPRFRPRRTPPRTSKLDPYKATIVRLLETHPYSAVQVFQRLREAGYPGGITLVSDYVRKVRPPKRPAFLTLAFAPGECAQVDWGEQGTVAVGNTRRRLSFFVMVLCYSRLMYLEFTVSQRMEHFLGCHQHAFEAFGAVPAKIMVDNLKCAVLQRLIGQPPVLNPRYLDFCNHYGCSIVPCGVGKGNEKGRVENGVGYVKKNFLNGLEIPDFAAVNPAARVWLETIANVRIHGETRERPIDRFAKERACLRPLPSHPYDIGTVHSLRASSQFRVRLDTNRYSVPAEYANRPVVLKAYPDRVCVYSADKLIARHVRCYDRGREFEDPDHAKALVDQRHQARDQKLLMRFLALSPQAEDYYLQLQQRRFNPRHHVRKMVALSEVYGPEKVARALEDALTFQAFSCEYIANLLEQRARLRPEAGALQLTRRQDLLELDMPEPDLSVYDAGD